MLVSPGRAIEARKNKKALHRKTDRRCDQSSRQRCPSGPPLGRIRSPEEAFPRLAL